MNRYFAAIFTGLYIILVGGVVVVGLIDEVLYTFDPDEALLMALGWTGLVACLVFGLHFGFQRASMDRPWRLARWHKVVIFTLAYASVRIVYRYIKAYVAISIWAGSPMPSMEIIYRAIFFEKMLRFPFSFIYYKPLQDLERNYEFVFFFVTGALWAVVGMLIIAVILRLKEWVLRGKH